ncbi:MAG TPA: hypothetical protein VFO46_19410 [Candidatus Sulfotelmatobacter sp.]|nr:hypothetical protein [Candidatus Sulfotelmatobacter sp.]
MRSAIQPQAKFLGMLLGLIVLAGCGSAGSGGSGKAPAPTATLTANPTTITAQGFSTLTYSSTNADSGVIDNGEGQVGLNGHKDVNPSVTTTYTYTVSGPGGTASAQATVTVTPAPPAPTIRLTVTPAAIFPGQSITFNWQSTNATSVVIDNIGPVTPGTGSVTPPQAMWPTQTTTYTAVAIGNNQQATATATVTVNPIISFDGLLPDSSGNGAFTKIDPNGAVGTQQFMEYVNTEYQAFDKTTHQPVLPPIPAGRSGQAIGTPWTTASADCAGTGIGLDAVINFDRLAKRWVIAGKAVRQSGGEKYYFCIAVSNTDDAGDPNFGWYAYSFLLNPILATGTKFYFPDWPKLGTWPDAYYATMDMLDPNGNDTENGVAVCAFDRNSMLSGAPMNAPQCFTDTSRVGNNGLYLAHSLIPADFDGTTPPPAGRDEFLVSIENPISDGTTTTSSSFNLWDFHLDWSNPTNTTLTVTDIPVTPPYTPGCYLPSSPAITNCVNEPPSGGQGQHIDSVGDRFMPRFAYRNFGSYESLLVSHTVKTAADLTNNPNQTGINWYELRGSGSGTPSLFQSGTINPDNSLFRFLPSIAQDKDANAAVGYNVSNSFTDPGIDFSYWNLATATAPTEISILSGTGEEVTPTTGTGNWGTYSSMTVDPTDDCTFWYVNEYWPTNAAWATRIAYFKVPNCTP